MDKLPAELIEGITDQITDEDIQSLHSLRRVCRFLERRTDTVFLRRCFGTRRITTTDASMSHLIKVMQLPRFGPLVKHLIVDACFGVEERASTSIITEALKLFAGRTLESITFIHTAEPGPLTERMAGTGWCTGRCTPSTLFLQRFCDVSAVVDAFLHIMDSLGIRVLRFSVPGTADLEIAYAVGPWVLDSEQHVLANLRLLELHVFPTGIDRRTGVLSVPGEDAMALASFVNSAPLLLRLRLSFAAEGLKAYDGVWLTQLPNVLFEALDMHHLEDLTLAGWQYPHWQSLLAFFQKHQKITRLQLFNMQIDALDIPLHKSWVRILEFLSLSPSLVEFRWKNLDTTSTARLETTDEETSIAFQPSSHRRACDRFQCNGRDSFLHCRQSGTVSGGHGNVAAVLSRMISNFEFPRTTLRQQVTNHDPANPGFG